MDLIVFIRDRLPGLESQSAPAADAAVFAERDPFPAFAAVDAPAFNLAPLTNVLAPETLSEARTRGRRPTSDTGLTQISSGRVL